MTKQEFLGELQEQLKGLPDAEVKDILYDYAEHIQSGIENGESEQEVIKRLGHPKSIAREFHGGQTPKREFDLKRRSPFKAFWLAIAIIFFNLTFVLGFWVGAWGIVASLLLTSVAFSLSGVVGIIALALSQIDFIVAATESVWETISILGFSVAAIAGGLLLLIGSVLITKWFFNLNIRYFKWNIKIIKGER